MTKKLTRTAKPRIREDLDQFKLIVNGVLDYAIFMLDTEGYIATWNAGAKRIKGYEESEIVGTHFSVFYPDEDVRSGKPEWELEVAQREGRFEDEGWRIRKDGSKFWANVVITAIRGDTGDLIGYGKVTRDFTERKEHDDRLAQSEERFRLLVEGVPDYAIYLLDRHGIVTTWNAGAERVKGYKPAEIIGKHFSTFFAEEDVRVGKPQQILDTAEREGRAEHEGWRIRKDGSRFWVNAVVTALRDKSGNLWGFSKITRDVTERMQQQDALQNEIKERRKAQEDLSKSEASLRTLSLNLLRTQDEERRRIGREMHDSLGQYLSALKMKLGTLRVRQPNLTTETSQELARCNELLEECVKEVRTISYLLYPPMLEEMGLKSAITWFLEGFTQRSDIKTELKVSADFDRVSRDVELALFRVIQESLNNIHKHSGSTQASIRLSRANGIITLEIRDYGKGLPQVVLEQSAMGSTGALGVGLRGMNERIRQLGGELRLNTAEPGTLVTATVPAQ
jgi:PAS domain S-box-containing protein